MIDFNVSNYCILTLVSNNFNLISNLIPSLISKQMDINVQLTAHDHSGPSNSLKKNFRKCCHNI